MSEPDHYECDQPAGDEFDDLLVAMRSYHNPEQFQEYTARIPELIYAVRQARQERDARREFAREQQRALRAEAAALVLHKALQQACDHIRRGTQPDQTEKRRWQQALAGLAAEARMIQHKCAEALATVAAIVLDELDVDGVQNSTHSLLAATLAAYQASRQP